MERYLSMERWLSLRCAPNKSERERKKGKMIPKSGKEEKMLLLIFSLLLFTQKILPFSENGFQYNLNTMKNCQKQYSRLNNQCFEIEYSINHIFEFSYFRVFTISIRQELKRERTELIYLCSK
jgi:hypothetical protein